MSKVANIATVKSSNMQKKTPDEVQNQKKNGSATKGPADGGSRKSPAFQGAKFDKYGYCLKHPSVQLVKPKKDGAGRIVYQELRTSCSLCRSDKQKSKRGTSLNGGKAPADHRGRGARGPRSHSRSKSRGRGEGGPERARARSRSRGGRPRREYDTPFDGKGRCHYHMNVQLAAKKRTGGWKVLQAACPKCMDEGTGAGDDRSVRSGASRASRRGGGDDRSVRSGASRASRRGGAGGDSDACGRCDDNGCCVLHPHIQIAKKKLFGAGFKVVRDCPKCGGGDIAADDYSVKSGRSARSTRSASSRKSRRSAKAAPRGRPGAATRSGRYGALPFDAEGYCVQHPSMQLAKKKALGGFKILHDVCPECQADDRGDAGSVASAASKLSSLSRNEGAGSSAAKKKRVRNLRTEDEEGRHGRYTGYVNSEHQPHGDGTMKYADGSSYAGVWSEGSKVHGKTTKRKAQ